MAANPLGLKSEQIYAMLAHTGCGIALVSKKNGRFTGANPQLSEMLETDDELSGQTFTDIIYPEDKEKAVEFLARLQRTSDTLRLECRCLTPDGEIRWLSWWGDYKRGTYYLIAQDITNEKHQKKELEDTKEETLRLQQKLLEEQKHTIELQQKVTDAQQAKIELFEYLSGIINHELRNLLQSLMSNKHDFATAITRMDAELKTLAENHRIPPQDIQTFHKAIKNLSELLGEEQQITQATENTVTDGLLCARASAGVTTPEPGNLRKIISDAAGVHASRARKKKICISIEIPEDAPTLVACETRYLPTVLRNLVHNAIKFTDEGGKITIHAQPDPKAPKSNMWQCSVQDNGRGIPEDQQKKIFQLFAQSTTSGSTRHKGFGVGLATVHQLVNAMEGTIAVKSTPEQGSTFTFSFRADELTPDQRRALVHAISPTPNLAPRIIILAEDNPTIQRMNVKILRNAGHTVYVAENGQEALDRYRQYCDKDNRPDVILMDIQMPQMDGVEATKKIRALEQERGLPAVPIVGLSANDLPGDIAQAREAGMTDYLTKPARKDAILRALSHATQHKAQPPQSSANAQSRHSR